MVLLTVIAPFIVTQPIIALVGTLNRPSERLSSSIRVFYWRCVCPNPIEGLTDCLNITATILDVAGAESLEDSDGVSFASQVLAGPDADGTQ